MSNPNFDGIARGYRFLEYLALGPALQNCRTHFLPLLHERKAALVLGDGDGRFVAALLRANSTLHATAVDTSATMLQLLGNRCHVHADRLTTLHQTALAELPPGPFDLIPAHFFFDCLTQAQVDTLIPRLTRRAAPDALWLISDFRVPPGPLRLLAKTYIRLLYLCFRVLTGLRTTRLPDHEMALRKAGLTRVHQHLSLCGLLTTEVWASHTQV